MWQLELAPLYVSTEEYRGGKCFLHSILLISFIQAVEEEGSAANPQEHPSLGKMYVTSFQKLTPGEFSLVACIEIEGEFSQARVTTSSNQIQVNLQMHQLFSSIHRGLAPGRQDKTKHVDTVGSLCMLSGSLVMRCPPFDKASICSVAVPVQFGR